MPEDLVVKLADIKSVAREIVARFHPERIILFGSYAYGKPTEDSDVDLMILVRGARVHDRALRIRNAIVFGFPTDVLVRSPEEFEKRIADGDNFLREISEKGKVLYEKSDAGVGSKGRGRLSHGSARGSRAKIAQS